MLLGAVAALVGAVASCGVAQPMAGYAGGDPVQGPILSQTDVQTPGGHYGGSIVETTVRLSNGTSVVCLTLLGYNKGGLSCNWAEVGR